MSSVIEIVRAVVVVYVARIDVIPVHIIDVSVVIVIPVDESIGIGDVNVSIVDHRRIVPPATP